MEVNNINDGNTVLTMEGLPMAAPGRVTTIEKIPLNKIKIGRNSRANVSDEEIAGLMQSIKAEGLLEPIGVMRNGNAFEIAYGNRRYLAVSKLGLKHIAAVVHTKKSETDLDMKNLTENIQRRNISLQEAGRFIELLRKDGLSSAEIAARIGVNERYIQHCSQAFSEVPKEFVDDLEVKTIRNDRKTTPGKIGLTTATKIISNRKKYDLTTPQMKKIFQAAKSDDRFNYDSIAQYARNIKEGKDDFISDTGTHTINIKFRISEKEKIRLEKKYVDDGPFRSVSALCIKILSGEKSESIKMHTVNSD